jgi:hypothetical protein
MAESCKQGETTKFSAVESTEMNLCSLHTGRKPCTPLAHRTEKWIRVSLTRPSRFAPSDVP